MELVINTSTEVVLQFKKEGVLGTIPQITQKLIKKAGYDICCIFTCNNGTAKLYVKNSEL